MPVLMIVGAGDPLFRPASIRSIANLLPNVGVVEIPGAGHSPYFYQPAQWNRVVLEFLREQD